MSAPSAYSGGRLEFPETLAQQLCTNDCEIILTGGGGWIGQAALEMLEAALGDTLVTRVRVYGSSARDLTFRSGRKIPCQYLEKLVSSGGGLGNGPKLFFHCAFLTKDRLQDQSIDAFIAGNKAISHVVAGAIESCDARGLFMPSSGAVYKKGSHILDDDMQANPYGVMKRHDEERFVKLAMSKKMPVCIPRLFNLAGPFINKIELYALASMITSCQSGQGITIRAPHRVIRSYIHVADLVTLGFDMLLNPKSDDVPVFDTAGEVALELSELADAIRNVLGKPETIIHRPDVALDKDDRYVGDGTQFARMMNAHGLTMRDINVQIRDTANYLANQAS